MRVFNEEKTQELTEYDLEKGRLRADRIVTKTIPAQPEQKEEFHYEFKTYPNGGQDRIRVIDKEYKPAQSEQYEYENIQVYVPYTEEQLKDIRKKELKDSLNKLSEDIIQVIAGAKKDGIVEKIAQFQSTHNELRILEGKPPCEYTSNNLIN